MAFVEKTAENVTFMTSDKIDAVHAFTTRFGGVSRGVYGSLNLGESRGDDENCVRENYARLKKALGIEGGIVFSRQVHKDGVRRVTGRDVHELFTAVPYEADALITDEKALPIIIFIADCIPVLFYDPVKKTIGAAHCGWRGTVMDMAGKTARRMAEEFSSDPKNIRAAIGPGIGQCCFETGEEVPEAVIKLLGADGERFIDRSDIKPHVDLKGVNRECLLRAGLLPENIDVSDECTKCLSDKYWSHRKTGGVRGSQAAIIMLKGN